MVILGILASISIPFYYNHTSHANEIQCLANRRAIERAAIAYYNRFDLIEGNAVPSVKDLVDMGYFDKMPECPKGGVYVWEHGTYSEDRPLRLGCSYHYVPPATP